MTPCPTCLDTQEVDIDTGRPSWPATKITAETPALILRGAPCPDCVPCVQCAHPDYDGICSCRKHNPGPGERILPKT